MKNCTSILLAIFIVFGSCNKENNAPTPNAQSSTTTSGNSSIVPKFRYSGNDYSQAISIQEANEMISSYLTSINYPSNTEALRSLTFDADSLRAYLNDSSHGKIVTLKFMLAHQTNYTKNHYGTNAGMRADAITLVLVGLDEDDNYIYSRGNKVYEHFSPCPTNCDNVSPLLSN